MTDIVYLEEARLEKKARRGYRNWIGRFGETFKLSTRLDQISDNTLIFLARGKENSPFYLYDLIMNILDLGSGFQFNDLDIKEKMIVMDRHLFLLDRIRFEYMKRSGWLDSYPGQEFTLIELVIKFDQIAPGIQAKPPALKKDHPDYQRFCEMNPFEKEEFIRRLLYVALKKMEDHSTTL